MAFTFDPQFLVAFLFATIRCSAWIAISPPFGNAIPVRVRAGLSMALGLAMAPRLLAGGRMPTDSTWGLLAGAVHQAIIGLALGILVYVLFQAVASAGSMIDAFAALTSAQIFDPLAGSVAGPTSRLYQILGTTVLFVSNGHLLLLRGLSRTFELSPISGFRLDRMGSILVHDVLTFLTAALQIGAPILGALFVTELLLGLASRAAPKLNIMVIGFGAKSLVLFMLLGAALPLIPFVSARLVHEAMDSMSALVKGG